MAKDVADIAYRGRRRIPAVRFAGRGPVRALLAVAFILHAAPAPGQVQVAGRDRGFVPYSEEPIRYLADRVNDPVAKLQPRIDRGDVSLEYGERHGYLESVLKLLDVPLSSQMLVFSKSSFQYRKISPQSPRALYFNDNVYVGWVRGGHSLELASFDANQGAIFYLLEQQRSSQPAFLRATLDCTQCHVAPGTRGVPGVLVRSIFTKPTGTQATHSTSFITGHESPLKDRFGGWYVTGTHGAGVHMGNVFVQDLEHPEELDRGAGANVRDLSGRFETSAYLSGHSDIVAQLVLAHQTQMHNLITLTNFQTRLALHAQPRSGESGSGMAGPLPPAARAQYERPAEELVRYLLFADEAPLDGPIAGTSDFAREFAARGPRDAAGRSLRDFDLRRRLFRYPCSYLIYSDAFDALPGPAKEYVYRRLLDVLTGKEQGGGYHRLSAEDRRVILEILVATKPGLPAEWRRWAAPTAARADAASPGAGCCPCGSGDGGGSAAGSCP
jgi:hypothetical protein